MKILNEIRKYFTFHKDTLSIEEDILVSARLYAFLGIIFTPINLIVTLKFQNEYNILAQLLITIGFVFILISSYKFKFIEKNINGALFIHFIIITYYAIINCHLKGLPHNEIFAILILFFVFGVVIEDIKKLFIYYILTTIGLIYSVLISDTTTIDKSYLFSFLSIFLFINYIVNRSKNKNRIKLQNREKFLKTLFNETADGFLLINIQTHDIVDCNNKYLTLFNLNDKSEIIGYKKDKFQKFKDTREDYDTIKKFINDKKIFHKNIVYISRNGREFIGDTVYNVVTVENISFYFVRITDISNQLESEKKIIKSERRYKTLVEKNVAGVFRTLKDGTFVELNNAFAEIFGYTKSELINEKASCLYINDNDRDEYIKELFFKEKLYNKTLNLKRKDGSEVWVLINVAIRNEENENYIEGTLIDITSIRKANEKIIESENRLNEAQKLAKIGSWILNHKTNKLIWSDEVYRIFGTDKKSINVSYETFKGFIHPDDVELIETNYFQSLKNKTPYEVIHRIILKDGSVKYVQEKGQTNYENDIPFVSLGTVQDITEQVLLNNKLIESEKRFKILSNVAIEGVVLSKNQVIIDANNQFVTMHGYDSIDEIIGKKISDFVLPEYYEVVQNYLKSKRNDFFIVKSRKKDGSSIFVETRGEDIPFGNETIRASVILDVTERTLKEKQIIESEERFKRLSEAAYEGIVIHKNGVILDANETFCKLIGYKHNELVDFNSLQLATNNTKKQILKKMQQMDTKPFEGVIKTKQGKEIYVTIRGRQIPYKGDVATVASVRDITFEKEATAKIQEEQLKVRVAEESNKLLNIEIDEREKVQLELRKTQKFLNNIINSSLDIIISTDKEGKITNFNKAAEKSFGYKAEELIGKESSILYKYDYERNIVSKALNSNDGNYFGEITNLTKQGDSFISFISASKLKDEEGNAIGSMGVSRDITNIKAAEEELRESEERYRDIFENASDMIQSVDNNGIIMFVNEAWKKTLGYKTDKEVVGKSIFDFLHSDGINHCTTLFTNILNGIDLGSIEIQFKTKKGYKIIAEGNISSKVENGKVVATRGIFRDITERLQYEEEIKQGLREKEILLAEIHHRVKNNLQVISSILNLQSSYVTDQGTLDILKESQNRVKSMSFIHESLYQTKDFSKINFSNYIKNLSSNLLYSYQIYDNLVELKTDLDDIQIDLDQSIPAGLIINELITNALKYGFPNEREGVIEIKLKEKNGFISIIVADNGVGMTKDINFENTDSLGLQLVHTLSEQLDAELTHESVVNKGVKFEIRFKKE